MQFVIPTENIKKFKAKIGCLNKKAVKLGCPEILVEEGKSILVPIGENKFYDAVEFEVEGVAPVIDGWEFLARLDPTPNGNLIQTVPGKTVPDKYGHTGSFCDHCKTDRRRKNLFVFKKDKEHIQVGRTCLKDFMGHNDPLKVAKWAELLMDLEKALDGYGEYTGSGVAATSVSELLAVAVRLVDQFGFVKANDENATKDRLSYYFIPTKKDDHWKKYQEKYQPTEKSYEKAEKIIEFIKDMDDSNYAHNLKVSVKNDYVEIWRSGLLASAVWVYMKEIEGAEKEKKTNEHIGNEGERLELPVNYVRGHYIGSGSYGDRYVYNFEDTEGRLLVWFTGKELDFEAGDSMKLKGTVKAHDEYKGRNQTIVTRCNVKGVG